MKKLLFVFGLVFLLVGCAAPQSVETHLPLISSIPPKYFEAAHTDLVIAESFVADGEYLEAYLRYRKVFAETNTEVVFFYYLAIAAAEQAGSNHLVYDHSKYLLERYQEAKFPLPVFYLDRVKEMFNRAALIKEASK